MKGLLRAGALCLAFAAIGASLSASAATAPPELKMTVDWIPDPGGHLRLTEVKALAGTRAFRRLPSEEQLQLAQAGGGAWFRITFSAATGPGGSYVLDVADARLDHVEYYSPNGAVTKTGSLYPASSRALTASSYAFPIGVRPQPQTLYLSVRDDSAATVPLHIRTAADFAKRQQRSTLLEALSYGELGTLSILGLVLGAMLRTRRLLLYGAFGASMAMALFAGNGHGRLYLWQEAYGFDAIAEQALLCLTAGMGTLLARECLGIRDTHARLDRVLMVGSLSFLLLGLTMVVALVFPSWHPIQRMLLLAGAPLLGLVVVATTVVALRQGKPGVAGFGIAHAIVWLGAVVASCRSLGLIPSNGLTFYALQWTASIGMLLMAFALFTPRDLNPRGTAAAG